MAGAVAAGGVIGLIRMGEGGHFLSDVIFAGALMALDVALMHWLVFDLVAPRVPDETWWHEKAVAGGRTLRTRLETFHADLRRRGKQDEDDLIGPPE